MNAIIQIVPTMLLVGPESPWRRDLSSLLNQEQIALKVAESDSEAIKYAQDVNLACVFVDYKFAAAQQFKLITKLRSNMTPSDTPIIFVSHSPTGDMDAFRHAQGGVADYLILPLSEEIVKSKVKVYDWLFKQRHLLKRVQTLQERNEGLSSENYLLRNKNNVLEDVTHAIGHNLSAPFRGILNLCQYIKDDQESALAPGSVNDFNDIHMLATRGKTLLDGLLAFTRIDDKASNCQTVDLDELIHEIAQLFLSDHKQLKIEYHGSVESLYAPEKLLKTVLTRLCSNVLEHSTSTSSQALVTITCQPCTNGYEFLVTDDGPSLSETALEDNHKLFYAAATDYTRGINLSIIHKLVASLGGTVSVTPNAPAAGSTVRFTLQDFSYQQSPAFLASANRQRHDPNSLSKKLWQVPQTPVIPESVLHDLQVHQIELESQNEELRQARDIAENQKYRFQSLFRSSPMPYLITSAEGKIVGVNKKAREMMFNEAHSPQVDYLNRHVFASDLNTLFSHLNRTKAKAGVDSCQLKWQTAKGSLLLQFNSQHLAQTDEILIAVVDITQEEAIKDHLKTARIEAEKANHLKSQFLANITHEIRTPLSAILGYVDLLSRNLTSTGSEQSHIFCDKIERNSRHLLSIVNDVLDLTKIEAGYMALNNQIVNITTELRGVLETLKHKASQGGLDLQLVVDPKVPTYLETDSGKVRQICFNLVGNAIKFTEAGRVAVDVDWHREGTSDHGQLLIKVIDTGPGIPDQEQHKLFKYFSQVSSGSARAHGGTGLGLVISKRLAQLLKGDVILESTNPGQGSVFSVSIYTKAVSLKEAADNNKQLPAHESEDLSPAILKGLKLLLAEDNADLQLLFATYLKDSGAQVDAADDGFIALSKALNNNYDVIIMDMEMPGCSGYDAVKILRREAGYDAPIIALTAHTLAEERQRCLAIGCTDFVAKPPSRRSLIEAIISNAPIERQKHSHLNHLIPKLANGRNHKYLDGFSNRFPVYITEIKSLIKRPDIPKAQIAAYLKTLETVTVILDQWRLEQKLRTFRTNLSDSERQDWLGDTDDLKKQFYKDLHGHQFDE